MTNRRVEILFCLSLYLMTCSCADDSAFDATAPGAGGVAYAEEALERRADELQTLWHSPLGVLFNDYINDPGDNETVNQKARALTDRMFQEPELASLRAAAIQLLTEHLYISGELNDEKLARVTLLQGDIWQRQLLQEKPQTGIAIQAVVAAVAALPFGSPAVRNGVKALGNKVFRFVPFLKKPRGTQSISEAFSGGLFKGYEFSKAIDFYLQTFGPYTLAYFFWSDWKEAAESEYFNDETLLPGYEDRVKKLSRLQ